MTKTAGFILLALALGLLFPGCSAVNQFDQTQPRFINKTSHPDSEVFATWEGEIATAADWIGKGYHDVPGAGVPGYDGKVISTPSPDLDTKVHRIATNLRGIVVEEQSDVPASIINVDPQCGFCPYQDPTGRILCPPNDRGEKYCDMYTTSAEHLVVPASRPDYFGPWGIMTILLHYCGTDMH